MNLAPALFRLVLSRIGWLFATDDERDAEILALRHQVLVLQRQIARPQFTETDHTILAVLSAVFDRSRRHCCIERSRPSRRMRGTEIVPARTGERH